MARNRCTTVSRGLGIAARETKGKGHVTLTPLTIIDHPLPDLSKALTALSERWKVTQRGLSFGTTIYPVPSPSTS